jgi:NitT/TauT family transport system substrate-binding protein
MEVFMGRLIGALLILLATHGILEGADKVKIGVANYNLSNLSVGVAQRKGFFKQEGIEAEIIAMRPSIVTAAMVSEALDYTTLIVSLVGAAVKGSPLKLIGMSVDRPPLSFVAQPRIKSGSQLKGTTIGVGSYGSSPDLVARRIVRHYGLDPDKDVKTLAFGLASARLTALQQGIVDVIIVAPPDDYKAKKMGFNILVRADELFTFPYNGLGTSTRKLQQSRDEVKRVLKAVIKANRFIRRDRAGTIQVLMEWAKADREDAAASYDSAFKAFSEDGSVSEDDLRLLVENASKDLKMPRQILPDEVADLSILHQAQKELGIIKP